MGYEFTVYLIAIMIVFSIGFVVHSMTKMNDDIRKKIASLSKRLHDLEIYGKLPKESAKMPSDLFGEVEIKHPKTGEKLRAPAHFRIRKNR